MTIKTLMFRNRLSLWIRRLFSSSYHEYPDTRVVNEMCVNSESYDINPPQSTIGKNRTPPAPKNAMNGNKSFTFNKREYVKMQKENFYNLYED